MLDRSTGSGPDHIGYHGLTQAAMRGVVRAVLEKAAKLKHLPGDHHFYVTFRTRTQGVQMDDSLKDRFPDEMTIVIQHQYSDFEVFDDRFEITLSFGGKAQHLRIPFVSIARFVDPSTNFGLQIETPDFGADEGAPRIIPERLPAPAPAEGSVVSLDAFRRK